MAYRYTIDSRDVDYTGRASLTAVIHYILDTAGRDADANGFGVRDLNHDNCTWVLTRMGIEFYAWPVEYDTFTVRTWVNEVNRVITVRNMEATDAEGRPISAAVTQWSVIDMNKRSALDVRTHIDYAGKVSGEPSQIDMPKRLRAIEAQQVSNHKVVYGDIDFNRHMNSLRYISLMTDMLPMEFFEERRIVRADLNFIQEAIYGQELTIGYVQHGNESLFEISDSSGQPLCRASFISQALTP